ncbi:uncharacterized protein LOC119595188 [Penaeus monodon]|uniref:uncharacterized protein LOC119595188 n=1 Tax=Penaeus monodon TaxID=6687 RepID=UPI0018A7267F|nr:uncharacterized protein LOC119595188 [Penaeus monodon]
MPEEWRTSTLIPIFKNKGGIQEYGNYRGIKLMSHNEDLRENNEQSDQRNRRSTTDAIYALRLLMEKYREGQRELHCVKKTYDRVPREEVWNCLRLKGVPESHGLSDRGCTKAITMGYNVC